MGYMDEEFVWKCEPEAERLILAILEETRKSTDVLHLEKQLEEVTSTRLMDWVDHVQVPTTKLTRDKVLKVGFKQVQATPSYTVFCHPGAQLPQIVLYQIPEGKISVSVSVEKIDHYLMVRGIDRKIEGTVFSGYRRCLISEESNILFYVVERAGLDTMEPAIEEVSYPALYFRAKEKWLTRGRSIANENLAWFDTLEITQQIIESIGKNRAAALILDCERQYWQSRNSAAQIQKNRQDRLGMGWANHDHHTFRSSRKNFFLLVRLFEMLGFHCRERYYAGEEAGWGAQVMENSVARLVLFLDVDLDSHEIALDFAHEPLEELPQLGTVGLWCALHGDSILSAGMHHLEAQFLFDKLSQDLEGKGISMMNPFSQFTYLKQAFTEGERWEVDPKRIDKLLREGKMTPEQAEKFKTKGAIGSHLENLQRREGYKGFNQKNVSSIIKKTDPRLFDNE